MQFIKNNKKSFTILALMTLSLLLIYATPFSKTKENTTAAYSFSGEEMPLYLTDVAERLDRELVSNKNFHSNSILVIKRANRVFPVIEPILAKHGIPNDFKYLAVIESGLLNVTSPAGAKGVWQFMPETAKEKGLEVTEFVDERYDIAKSTEAACLYLKEAYAKFGNWTLAAASYNGGMNGVQRQLDNQQVTSYYDVLLTEETARYIYRIVALKEIMEHSEKYGFVVPTSEKYPVIPTRTIEVDSSVTNLSNLAKSQGINYKILKIHNPWLRDRTLPNKTNKKYQIEIPTSGYFKK